MKTKTIILIIVIFIAGFAFAREELIEWADGKIRLDEDGHYRGPAIKRYEGEVQTMTVDHTSFGQTKPDCQSCHNNPDLGYDYVSSEKFTQTKHFKAMLNKEQISGIQEACLVCHVDNENNFIPFPGDNMIIPEKFSIYNVANNNTSTCGKCHKGITERNKDHIMATAKGHYYRSEIFPYMEALGVSAENVYRICNVCHTSCASSCHMVGQDKKAVDWTFIQPFLDHKVGESKDNVKIKVGEGVEFEAEQIREFLVGHYIKGGGPGYRSLAKIGKAPLETIKIDIESHEIIMPSELSKSDADDICLRCHTCMVDPLDRLRPGMAHQAVKCVDCHREGDVHGHKSNQARFAYEAVDATCETCHLKKDLYKGNAAAPNKKRDWPIVNPVFYKAAPTVPPLKGAHEKVSCAVCHSEGIKQCNECHVGNLVDTVGDIKEIGYKAVFYGKDINGVVRFMLIHEIYGKDGKKYGGWILKNTVHGLKRDSNTNCETCHTNPVRMGVSIPELRLINTYLIRQAGVPEAYIDKVQHYMKTGAPPDTKCVDCHSNKEASLVEQFHQAWRKN